MAQLFGSSFWSRLNPAVCPEASGGATKSNTRANRSVARPTDSHFLIGALLSTLTLGMALILTRTAAYLNAPSLAAVKVRLPRCDRVKPHGTSTTTMPHGSVPVATRPTTLPAAVSITATSPARPTVTYRRLPSGVSAVHQARGPTAIVASTSRVEASRTRMSPDPPCDTHARFPSRLKATSTGRLPPVGADFSTLSVSMLT